MSFAQNLLAASWLLTLLLTLTPACATGRTDSLLFVEDHSIDPATKGELRLDIDGMSFFRNNEYESPLAKGYTLPGFWLRPTVAYQPLDGLKLEGGAYMLHYWGATKYPNLNYSDLPNWKGSQAQKGFHLLPILRVQYAFSPRLSIVVGSLYGHGSHGLVEPLYTEELDLQGDPEAGVQVLWDAKRFSLDVWVDWESFIFDNDNHQESFTFGLASRFLVNGPAEWAHVYFPLQLLAQHRGGEINSEAKDREVRTWVNAATGAGLRLNLNRGCLKDINLEVVGTYYGQQSGSLLPFNNGWGLYSKAGITLGRFSLGAGYWHGHHFVSIHGNPLFGCVSTSEEGLTIEESRLVRFHADYAHAMGHGFSLAIHADAWGHLGVEGTDALGAPFSKTGALSLSFGVCLRFNPSFLLWKAAQ